MLQHRSNQARAPWRRVGSSLLLAVLAAGFAAPASAADRVVHAKPAISPADLANPGHFHCVGKNRFSGVTSVPTERSGATTDHAYAAIYFDPVHGHATIIYGERYQQTAPLFQAFIRRHECQHANGVLDEIMANCGALEQMRALGLTLEQESRIAAWHAAEGSIDARYGGSGARFWQRTLDCAGAR